jgi:hypothetical protein
MLFAKTFGGGVTRKFLLWISGNPGSTFGQVKLFFCFEYHPF